MNTETHSQSEPLQDESSGIEGATQIGVNTDDAISAGAIEPAASSSGDAEGALIDAGMVPVVPERDATGFEALRARLNEVETRLKAATDEVEAVVKRGLIQRALMEAQAIDLEAASQVVDAALNEGVSEGGTVSERDVRRAVQEVRRRRPALFRPPPRVRIGAMGPRLDPGMTIDDGSRIVDAAASAIRSGERSDLMKYLRMRRS